MYFPSIKEFIADRPTNKRTYGPRVQVSRDWTDLGYEQVRKGLSEAVGFYKDAPASKNVCITVSLYVYYTNTAPHQPRKSFIN